jgi:hypothetical protein
MDNWRTSRTWINDSGSSFLSEAFMWGLASAMQCKVVVLHRHGSSYHGDARLYDPTASTFMTFLPVLSGLTPLLQTDCALVVEYNGSNHFTPWVRVPVAPMPGEPQQSILPVGSVFQGDLQLHGSITREAADVALKSISRAAVVAFPEAGVADMPVVLQLDAAAFRTLRAALPTLPEGPHRTNISNVIKATVITHDLVYDYLLFLSTACVTTCRMAEPSVPGS